MSAGREFDAFWSGSMITWRTASTARGPVAARSDRQGPGRTSGSDARATDLSSHASDSASPAAVRRPAAEPVVGGHHRLRVPDPVWNIAGWVVPAIVAFAATPYTVAKLGDSLYGVLALSTVIASIGLATDPGFGEALVREVADADSRSEAADYGEALGSALLVYTAYGLGGASVLWYAAPWIIHLLLDGPSEVRSLSTFVVRVTAVTFLVSALTNVLSAVPRGLRLFGLSNALKACAAVAQVTLTVLVLYLGFSLRAVIVAQLASGVCALLAHAAVAAALGRRSGARLRFSWQKARGMFSFGVFKLLQTVTSIVGLQVPPMLLTRVSGPEPLTYYAVPGNIANKIHGLVAAGLYGVFPTTSALAGAGRDDEMGRVFLKNLRRSALMASALALAATSFGRELLAGWVGAPFDIRSAPVLGYLGIAYGLASLTVVPYYVALGLGRADVVAVYGVGFAILSSAFAWWMIPPLGAVGASMALACANAVSVVGLLFFVHRRLLKLPWPWLGRAVGGPVALAFGVAVVARVASASLPANLGASITASLLIAAFYLVIAMVIGLVDLEDRRALLAWLRLPT